MIYKKSNFVYSFLIYKIMIKKWNEYIKENLDGGSDYLSTKMEQLKDLISNIDKETINSEFIYNWDNESGEYLVVNFIVDDLSYRYELDLKYDTPFIVKKIVDGNEVPIPNLKTSETEEGIEEGIEIIEEDILNILEEKGVSKKSDNLKSFSEFNEKRAEKYKGRKIPGKYLTKNTGKMKKEIDTFRGKKEYKKDWDADYTSGKGGEGKRVKTKKSAATIAYQKKFGKE